MIVDKYYFDMLISVLFINAASSVHESSKFLSVLWLICSIIWGIIALKHQI